MPKTPVLAAALLPLIGIFSFGLECELPNPPALAAEADAVSAHQWETTELRDLQPLASSLVALVQLTSDWRSGTASASEVIRKITLEFAPFKATLKALGGLPLLSGAPEARGRFLAGVELYLWAFRIELAAAAVPAGPLQSQLQLSFERVRDLGDRVYDQGVASLPVAKTTTTTSPDVQVLRPLPVPNWQDLQLAPGPPLADATTNYPDAAAPAKTQSIRSWVLALHGIGIPGSAKGRQAIALNSVQKVTTAADKLQLTASLIGMLRPPVDHASLDLVTQLSLLVDVEGLRGREAALLAPGQHESLNMDAQALLSIGDSLWDTGLLGDGFGGRGGTVLSQTLSAA